MRVFGSVLILTVMLLAAPLMLSASDFNPRDLYGVWRIDRMVMQNGSSFPGSGDKLEFTQDGVVKTIMGSTVITNLYRMEGDTVYVRAMSGEAEHRIESLSGDEMVFRLPDGIVYELTRIRR